MYNRKAHKFFSHRNFVERNKAAHNARLAAYHVSNSIQPGVQCFGLINNSKLRIRHSPNQISLHCFVSIQIKKEIRSPTTRFRKRTFVAGY